MGDYHVRFCERLGVKFPLSTRHKTVVCHLKNEQTNHILSWTYFFNLTSFFV